MLLHQLDPRARSYLLATDIHEASIARARRGIFTAQDLLQVPLLLRARYFEPAGKDFRVARHLQQGIEFACHDLLCDPFPMQVDLILCRNVYIYFTQPVRSRIFASFYAALCPGGYLLVGNTERMREADKVGFTSPLPHFYQKP